MRNYFLTIMLTALFVQVQTGKAQNLVSANPAEFSDFRSSFVNPAIISFQDAHVAVGAKLYHLGFVENQTSPFRHGFVSMVLPFGINDLASFGLQAQYFNSPLFSRSNISVAATWRVRRRVSLGLKLNLFSQSFNRDNFDLVDANDPVFANGTTKWNGTVGAGIALLPLPFLSVGAGVDHINRVDISLSGDNVHQPLKGYVGAVLSFGFLQTSLSAVLEKGKVLPRTSIRFIFTHMGYALIGLSDKSLQAEAQLRISGPMSLNYSYDYTLFDNQGVGSGSHQLTFIHEFGRVRTLPDFEMPDEVMLPFQAPTKPLLPEPRFYIHPTTNKLEIIEKRLTRIIDPAISQEALTRLSPLDLGVLDSSRTEQFLPFEKDTLDMDVVPDILETNLSENYRTFLERLSEGLKEGENITTNVVTGSESVLRAAELKNYFDPDHPVFITPNYRSREDSILAGRNIVAVPIRPTESLTLLSVASTNFTIMPLAQKYDIQQWKFVIEDANGVEVREFGGRGLPPPDLEWNWTDHSGKLILTGVYYYYLEWFDSHHEAYHTDKDVIVVEKLLRNITIEITNKPKQIGAGADEIDIILKK